MCSCDLYAPPRSESNANPVPHLRREYEKRGWSEAKIQRAIKQAAAKVRQANRTEPGFRADVVDCVAALCRATGGVALFVHWYNGDVETERLSVGHARRCRCDELPARTQQLTEGQLLVATARGTSSPPDPVECDATSSLTVDAH
jgi:hypothetical protein